MIKKKSVPSRHKNEMALFWQQNDCKNRSANFFLNNTTKYQDIFKSRKIGLRSEVFFNKCNFNILWKDSFRYWKQVQIRKQSSTITAKSAIYQEFFGYLRNSVDLEGILNDYSQSAIC